MAKKRATGGVTVTRKPRVQTTARSETRRVVVRHQRGTADRVVRGSQVPGRLAG